MLQPNPMVQLDPEAQASASPDRLEDDSEAPRPASARAPVPPLQQVLDQAALSGVRWLAAGVAAIFVVFIVASARSLVSWGAQIEMALDVLVLAGLSGLLLACRRGLLPARAGNAAVLAIGIAVLINICVSATFGEHVEPLGLVPYVVIGAGSFLLSLRYLVVGSVAIAAISLPVALQVYSPPQALNFLVTMLAGFVLSFAVHTGRMRYLRRNHALRLRDAHNAAELSRALTRLEDQFEEHKRSEVERQRLEEQLRQSQKMEAIGRLAGGVAHDMNNVLSVIMGIGSLMRDEREPDDPAVQDIDDILTATRRGSSLTRNLLGFARRGALPKARMALNPLVGDVLQIIERTIPKGITVETRLSGQLADIDGDGGQLSQMLMNLCLNAVDALQGEGTLTITTRNVPATDAQPALEADRQDQVEMSVRDDGAGMEPEVLERAFEPFFTTKEAGKGTGLGLAMAFGSVHHHNGQITLASKPGAGSTVTIRFPALPFAAAEEPVAEDAPRQRKRRAGTVLVVDDEPLIRSTVQRALTRLGFEVLLAEHGQAGLERFREQPDRIDLIVLDMAMPVMDGAECFRQLRALRPTQKVILISGYTASHGSAEALRGSNGFLQKPFEPSELEDLVLEVLAAEREPSEPLLWATQG